MDQKKRIRELYGADEHTKKPDARLLLGQTEAWVEYGKDGRVVKGAPRAIVRSKYQVRVWVEEGEDVRLSRSFMQCIGSPTRSFAEFVSSDAPAHGRRT